MPLPARPLRGSRRPLVPAVLGALVLLAGCGPVTVVCGTHIDGCMLMDPDGTRIRVRGPLREPFPLLAGGSLALELLVEPPLGEEPAAQRRITVDAPWPLQTLPFPSVVRGRGGIRVVLRAPEDALEQAGAGPEGMILPVRVEARARDRQVGGVFFDVRVLPPP